MDRKSKILKIIAFVLILAFYASLLAYKIKVPAADDLPRQIKLGQEVLTGNFGILYKNTFSYIEPDYTFYNHHWLSGVVFYFLDKSVGWDGLVVFKIIVLLAAFALIFKSSLKKGDFWLVALISIPVIIMLRERSGLRPEIFSYLFLAVFLYTLLRFEEKSDNKMFWLIPLQLIWVNMHVFFSVGIMLVAGFLFEKIIHNWGHIKGNPQIKKLSILFVSILLISFINPRGIGGVFYRYPEISLKISENQTLNAYFKNAAPGEDLSLALLKPMILVLILSLLVFFFYRKKGKMPIFFILAGLATIGLSFLILRGMSFFAFIFLLTTPMYLTPIFDFLKEKFNPAYFKIRQFVALVLISFLFMSLSYLIYLARSGFLTNYAQLGVGAASMSGGGINFFKENNLKGPIFNDADIGSYLIYYLYPTEKVFSDNRFGDAYSPEFWNNLYLPVFNDEDAWRRALNRYDFNVIFLYQYDSGDGFRQFMYNRFHDPEWAFVYGDPFSIIFVRNTLENREVIEKTRITSENAQQRLAFLTESDIEDDKIAAADIFNLLGRLDLSREVFLDVVLQRPNNGKIWMIMGEWELALEDPMHAFLASMYLEKAISVGQKTAEAYSFLGVAYYRMGKYEMARKVLEESLAINPERQDAQSLLNLIIKEHGER